MSSNPVRFPVLVLVAVLITASLLIGRHFRSAKLVQQTPNENPVPAVAATIAPEESKAMANPIAHPSESPADQLRRRILAGENWRVLYAEIKATQDPVLRDALYQVMVETLYNNIPAELTAMLHAGGLDPSFVAKVGPLLAESIRQAGDFRKLPETLGFLGNEFIAAASFADPHMALDWVNANMEGLARDIALLSVTSGLARQDPAEALRQLDTIQNAESKGESAREIGRSWAGADGPAALAWAKSLPEGDERTMAMQGTLATLSRSDPQTVAQDITAYANNQDFAYIGNLLGNTLAATDPRGAMDTFNQLPDGPVKQQATLAALQTWGQSDFAQAEAYVTSLPSATPEEMRKLYSGAGDGTDPATVWQKIQAYSDPVQQQQAMGGYVESYMLHAGLNNPGPMLDFVNTLPVGSVRDYAQAELANYYFSAGDPNNSWDHALQVQSPDLRSEAIFTAWWITENNQGVDAANAQLARAQLSQSQFDQVKTMVDQLYTGGVGALKVLPIGFKPGGVGNTH